MDIVFYGNSLNYDQGSGNYQELKKITKWDGRQYTFVSRYALRYSLLETAKKMGLWNIAEGAKLNAAGTSDKKVIQPATDFLLSGEILNYPEFDLFGYLITNTKPQNTRTAPVKIDNAISMTPFNYDALFNANLGLANRMKRRFGEMKPNPFTTEEHATYYQYSVVVDIDNIGELEVYIKKGSKIEFEEDNWVIEDVIDENKLIVKLSKGEKENKELKEIIQSEMVEKFDFNEIKDLKLVKYSLKKNFKDDPVKGRVCELITTILNLKRSIKAREEDLSPKLMIFSVYKNKPYKTYKDKIALIDEYVEEEYDEIEESPLENGGRVIRVRHKTTKSRKPVFEINGIESEPQLINEKAILKLIDLIFNSDDEHVEEVNMFYDSSVNVKIEKCN